MTRINKAEWIQTEHDSAQEQPISRKTQIIQTLVLMPTLKWTLHWMLVNANV